MQQYRSNSYLFGGNAPYVEELYEAYLDNPGSVPDNWRAYFDALQNVPAADGTTRRTWRTRRWSTPSPQRAKANAFGNQRRRATDLAIARKQVHVQSLIAAYRNLGSRWADLDPLKRQERPKIPELEPAFYGFTDADHGHRVQHQQHLLRQGRAMTLRELSSAARNLLRHHRRRVHVHHRPGREALVAAEARIDPLASRTSAPRRRSTSSTA